jgi:hypothetical protein
LFSTSRHRCQGRLRHCCSWGRAPRSERSKEEILAGELAVTYHVVVAFDWDAEGDLQPGEAQEVMSPVVAERRARALSLEHAGALAFSRTGNPATGEFQEAVLLTRFGEVDLDSLRGERRCPFRTALADQDLCWIFAKSRVQISSVFCAGGIESAGPEIPANGAIK